MSTAEPAAAAPAAEPAPAPETQPDAAAPAAQTEPEPAAQPDTTAADEARAKKIADRDAEVLAAYEADFAAEEARLKEELDGLTKAEEVATSKIAAATDEIKARDDLETNARAAQDRQKEREDIRKNEEATTDGLEARVKAAQPTIDDADSVAAIEEFLLASKFNKLWELTVEADTIEKLMETAPEDGMSLDAQQSEIRATRSHHEAELKRTDEIQQASLAVKKAHEEQNNQFLDDLRAPLDDDVRRLAAAKPKLRMALNDQRFHLRRGTHLKSATVARRAKDEFLALEQAKQEQSRICESINEEEYQLLAVTRELDELKREKTHLLKTSAVEKAALLSNVDKLNKEVETVAWEQKTLEDENQAMRDMRRDMIRTAAQVRTQLRS